MDSLHHLEELFAKFPGIGPRQAKRFVYYLLNKPTSYIKDFIQLIEDVKKSSSECPECHRIFIHNSELISHNSICPVCSDSSRDQSTLMVVARDSDFETVEKSGAYKGLYFILGGTVPVLDKDPEKRIRLKLLLERASPERKSSSKNSSAKSQGTVEKIQAEPLKEIILSLNTTPDGEHTATIVKEALSKVLENSPLPLAEVTILGRGLSTGAELEYVDGETIKNALQNRH